MPMTKNPFNGQLNVNEIFAGFYNMVINQRIYEIGVKNFGLAEKFRTEGSLYGDTELFYSTDVLRPEQWHGDAEASNLLAIDRPIQPKCQAITLDTFYQVRVTVDAYLSKQAWSTEGAFNKFNTVMLAWIGKTKDVSDNTLINAHVGTTVSTATNAAKSITLAASPTTIADYQLRGMQIGKGIADLLIDMKDYTRNYNGNSFLRNYDPEDFMLVWNAEFINEIEHISLPAIFHKDSVLGLNYTKNILPKRYFGTIGAAAVAAASVTANTYRSLIECDYVTATTSNSVVYHVRPGDYIPASGKKLTAGNVVLNANGDGYVLSGSGTASAGIAAGEYYTEDNTIIAKLVHKESVKFKSAFQVATEFWNPRSLTENHYLTYGYGLDDLVEFPIIKILAA